MDTLRIRIEGVSYTYMYRYISDTRYELPVTYPCNIGAARRQSMAAAATHLTYDITQDFTRTRERQVSPLHYRGPFRLLLFIYFSVFTTICDLISRPAMLLTLPCAHLVHENVSCARGGGLACRTVNVAGLWLHTVPLHAAN